jgi:hypothetical protein
VLVSLLAERLVYEQLGCRPAELMAGLAYRGERHRRRGGEVDVVVTNEGNVLRDPDPVGRHLLEHTEREQVVRAEDGSWPGFGREFREGRARLLPG